LVTPSKYLSKTNGGRKVFVRTSPLENKYHLHGLHVHRMTSPQTKTETGELKLLVQAATTKTETGELKLLVQAATLVSVDLQCSRGRALSISTLDSCSSPVAAGNRKNAAGVKDEAKALWQESRESWSTEEGDMDIEMSDD